jgi:hypothetical protein
VNNFLYLTNFFIPISLLLTISTRIFCAMPTSEAICGILTDMQGSYVNYCITFYIRVRKTNKNLFFKWVTLCEMWITKKKRLRMTEPCFIPGCNFYFHIDFVSFSLLVYVLSLKGINLSTYQSWIMSMSERWTYIHLLQTLGKLTRIERHLTTFD